jgi:hypothetical protein
MKNTARILREQHPDAHLHILVAKSNSGNYTYDGIAHGGERLCKEIEDEIATVEESKRKVQRMSIVGYSMGGLFARYAIGLLESRGVFHNIQPMVGPTWA